MRHKCLIRLEKAARDRFRQWLEDRQSRYAALESAERSQRSWARKKRLMFEEVIMELLTIS
jgi:hypothetical protein